MTLWHAFILTLREMLEAVRQMPTWVYLLLLFAAAVANILAVMAR